MLSRQMPAAGGSRWWGFPGAGSSPTWSPSGACSPSAASTVACRSTGTWFSLGAGATRRPAGKWHMWSRATGLARRKSEKASGALRQRGGTATRARRHTTCHTTCHATRQTARLGARCSLLCPGGQPAATVCWVAALTYVPVMFSVFVPTQPQNPASSGSKPPAPWALCATHGLGRSV